MEAAGIIGISQTFLRLAEFNGKVCTLLGEFLDLLFGTLHLVEPYQAVDVSLQCLIRCLEFLGGLVDGGIVMRNNPIECLGSLESLVHGEFLVLGHLDQVLQLQLFLYYLLLGFCLDGIERLLRLSCCIGCLPHIPKLHGEEGDSCGYQSEDVGLGGSIEGCHCRLGLTQLKG